VRALHAGLADIFIPRMSATIPSIMRDIICSCRSIIACICWGDVRIIESM